MLGAFVFVLGLVGAHEQNVMSNRPVMTPMISPIERLTAYG